MLARLAWTETFRAAPAPSASTIGTAAERRPSSSSWSTMANCKVQVRFAPGRENATSNASLVITSNAQNSQLKVSLTGTSSGLP
jgi:hypothetical protein